MKKAICDEERLTVEERQIVARIQNAPIPTVPPERIKAAQKAASIYYIQRQSLCDRSFWRAAFSCWNVGSTFFWPFFAFLLGSCTILFRLFAANGASPLALLTTVSPIPMLSFMIRELYARDEALAQLERTCKIDPVKICFVRLWGGMLCNMLFMILVGALAFSYNGSLIRTYLCAFIALFYVGTLALLLLPFLHEPLPLSFILAAWILAASYLLHQQELLENLMKISIGALLGALLAGFGLFIAASIHLTKKLYD